MHKLCKSNQVKKKLMFVKMLQPLLTWVCFNKNTLGTINSVKKCRLLIIQWLALYKEKCGVTFIHNYRSFINKVGSELGTHKIDKKKLQAH